MSAKLERRSRLFVILWEGRLENGSLKYGLKRGSHGKQRSSQPAATASWRKLIITKGQFDGCVDEEVLPAAPHQTQV
jgi:hypothetical protein